MKNTEEVNLTTTHGYRSFKSEFHGLNKKSKLSEEMVLYSMK